MAVVKPKRASEFSKMISAAPQKKKKSGNKCQPDVRYNEL
jgi:hypothetical protein